MSRHWTVARFESERHRILMACLSASVLICSGLASCPPPSLKRYICPFIFLIHREKKDCLFRRGLPFFFFFLPRGLMEKYMPIFGPLIQTVVNLPTLIPFERRSISDKHSTGCGSPGAYPRHRVVRGRACCES